MNIPFLDILRGLAAILVVFYHAQDVIVSETPELTRNALYYASQFGKFGVELFFVISGYCILAAAINGIERGKGVREFVVARVRRIFPTYWVSLVATLLVAGAMAVLVQKGVIASSQSAERLPMYLSPVVLATNISLTQLAARQPLISIVAWTLCYEVAFYAIVTVLMLGTAKTKLPALMLLRAVHVSTAVVLIAQIALPGKLMYPLDMWAMFGLGAAVFHAIRAERAVSAEQAEAQRWLVGLIVLTLGVIARGQGTTVSNMVHPAVLGFLVTLGGVGILWLVRNISQTATGKGGHVLSIVGGFSYSLYLIHFLCIGLANQAFHILKMPSAWHYVHFLLMVAVSMIAGFVFFLVAEKPFLKLKSRKPVESGLTPVAEVAP